MTRILMALAAVLALAASTPALACPDCHDCPMHKDQVAAADKAEKKDVHKCACGKDPKDCKCAPGKCTCAKADKKGATKS